MQAPFSHMLFFGHVKDFSLPNMFPPLPPSLAPTTLLSWESWMRDKDESLYLHSLLLLYNWGIFKLFFYLSEVSVLAHGFYYTVKGMLKKRPIYTRPAPTLLPHPLPKKQFYLLTPEHGVGKQQPYPCLQRPCRLLLASYPLLFSRQAGFVLQRWVSVNVVCSLVTVLKPLMTLTRSSSSTYCKEGKKEACQPKLYQTKGDSLISLSSYPLKMVLK